LFEQPQTSLSVNIFSLHFVPVGWVNDVHHFCKVIKELFVVGGVSPIKSLDEESTGAITFILLVGVRQ
jgi:hypothetical protein